MNPPLRPLALAALLASAALGFFCTRLVLARGSAARDITVSIRAPASRTSPIASRESSTDRWSELSSAPDSRAAALAREAFLEELARTDPKRALALAAAEPNWLARDRLRAAALRGWAAVEPDAAVDWSLAQPVAGERLKYVCAALEGSVAQPAEARRVGLRACAADPELAGTFGHYLVNAFVARADDFDSALSFATDAKMVDRQSFILDSAFYQWAQHRPDEALARVAAITDPAIRAAALKGVIEGVSDHDPQAFADRASQLPAGPDRSQSLAIALPRWAETDPEAALRWINRQDPDPDLDSGLAALSRSGALSTQPELAIELAEGLCDPVARTLARSRVFFDWALRDPAAARRYAEAVPDRETRETLLQDLASVPAPGS